mmetsp:Transcript_30162/g.64032  ORF Transcript_30162/g.64032 Transcript_30162/m.64032 type:complete len:254 (-) Transcript_30162:1109-1870(-)
MRTRLDSLSDDTLSPSDWDERSYSPDGRRGGTRCANDSDSVPSTRFSSPPPFSLLIDAALRTSSSTGTLPARSQTSPSTKRGFRDATATPTASSQKHSTTYIVRGRIPSLPSASSSSMYDTFSPASVVDFATPLRLKSSAPPRTRLPSSRLVGSSTQPITSEFSCSSTISSNSSYGDVYGRTESSSVSFSESSLAGYPMAPRYGGGFSCSASLSRMWTSNDRVFLRRFLLLFSSAANCMTVVNSWSEVSASSN